MKGILSIIVVVVAAVLFIGGFYLWGVDKYDQAVVLQEKTDESWADVQADYQRRADLVPQLIATVKGAAANEKEILTTVTNARAGIPAAIEPKDLEVLGKQINSAIKLTFERYPEIKSTQNFNQLQAQLEGTENRINTSRKRFNEAATKYNSHVRKKLVSWGINLVGSVDEFPKRELFEADAGTEVAPEVSFE